MSIFIQGREPGREVWPTCRACGQDLEISMYRIYGELYCHDCAVDLIKTEPELFDEIIEDWLAFRRETPSYEFDE